MSLDSLLVHTVTVVRAATTVDRYGNTVKDWDAATRRTLRGRMVQLAQAENRDGREAEIGTWRVFLPADDPINGRDRVQWDGLTFEVDGPPNRAWNGTREHHVEAALRIVEG